MAIKWTFPNFNARVTNLNLSPSTSCKVAHAARLHLWWTNNTLDDYQKKVHRALFWSRLDNLETNWSTWMHKLLWSSIKQIYVKKNKIKWEVWCTKDTITGRTSTTTITPDALCTWTRLQSKGTATLALFLILTFVHSGWFGNSNRRVSVCVLMLLLLTSRLLGTAS